jgi:tripartite ATP-independent transporter DctM subunit
MKTSLLSGARASSRPQSSFAGFIGTLYRMVIRFAECVAALLTVAEVLILFVGVIFRYAVGDPLTWSDELASILFIWLAMLGAVIALDRGEHMRLSTVVNRLSPSWQNWLETFSTLVVCVFIAFVIVPAYQHAAEQDAITTPALSLPDSLRAAALPVGITLMFVTSIFRMAQRTTVLQFGGSMLVIGVIGAALWLAQPFLLAIGNYNLIVLFVVLITLCVIAGIPIAFAFGTATLSYLLIATDVPLEIVVSRADEGMSSMILLSVPLFVLLGALIEISGMARSLIDFMASLLGHIRGGLQYVLLAAMFLVSGISGSKAADMAAVAPALFPEMIKRGSKPEELVALLSATGAMTETIPPSLVLITIGAVCSVSITALFVGGLIPAVIATAAIALVCYLRSRREPHAGIARASWKTIRRSLIIALPSLLLPVVIRMTVIRGVATATEAATVGIAYAIVVGLLSHLFGRRLDFRRLYPALVATASLSGAILLIIGMATAMAWALTQSGFAASLVEMMKSVPGGKLGFLAISTISFVILGSVLEGLPAIVLFGPLLFPVARSMGVNDVHYAMVVILSMGVGLFSPPMGVGFYSACGIGKVSPDKVMNRMWQYIAVLGIALLAVILFPWLSTGFL